jgi:hypothetical protein
VAGKIGRHGRGTEVRRPPEAQSVHAARHSPHCRDRIRATAADPRDNASMRQTLMRASASLGGSTVRNLRL